MKTSFLITAVLIARRLLSHLTALPSISAFENRRKSHNVACVTLSSGKTSNKFVPDKEIQVHKELGTRTCLNTDKMGKK